MDRRELWNMMDELTRYVLFNYFRLLTKQETQVWNMLIHDAEDVGEEAEKRKHYLAAMVKHGFLAQPGDPEIDRLLEKGEEYFFLTIRERILAEHADAVILKRCPVCGRLARTPQAAQCPNGHRWAVV